MGIINKRIGIVGGSLTGFVAAKLLATDVHKVEVINKALEPEPIPYTMRPIEISEYPFSGKVFTCKGKHQYRETKGEWVCQCGRNMKD